VKLIERFPGCYVEEEPRVNVCISEKTVRALTEGQGEAWRRLIEGLAVRINKKCGKSNHHFELRGKSKGRV